VLVAFGRYQYIENLAFGINRPPQIDHTTNDSQKDFVEATSCRDSGGVCAIPPR
jgi:hypothetical protein